MDNFSWHTPVLHSAWPFLGTAAATAVVGAMLGGLCGRVFGNVFWRSAGAGALLAVVLIVSLVLLHAKWAVLFLVGVGLTTAVFWYEGKQRHASGEPSHGNSSEVSRRAVVILTIGYAALAGAALALVNLT